MFKQVLVSAITWCMLTSLAVAQPAPAVPNQSGPPKYIPALVVTSSAYADGAVIPNKYTGANPSPVSIPVSWTNVPAGTQSFTLLMHDPDTAPAKSSTDILHWLAFNIPATPTSLPEGLPNVAQLPDGTVQPKNRNSYGFAGPGAPPGPYHHYTIEIYALDTKLALSADATRADVMKAMDGHVLAKGELVGRFHR
jgi:Raf kinase inhibitor-like YbhB/YbcL family protein